MESPFLLSASVLLGASISSVNFNLCSWKAQCLFCSRHIPYSITFQMVNLHGFLCPTPSFLTWLCLWPRVGQRDLFLPSKLYVLALYALCSAMLLLWRTRSAAPCVTWVSCLLQSEMIVQFGIYKAALFSCTQLPSLSLDSVHC